MQRDPSVSVVSGAYSMSIYGGRRPFSTSLPINIRHGEVASSSSAAYVGGFADQFMQVLIFDSFLLYI